MGTLTQRERRDRFRGLVDRITTGEGHAPRELRRHAFDNAELPSPLHAFLENVARRPTRVTDSDFDAARAAGFSEDQLFELVICAAVGQAARQYEAGLAALADV